VYVIFTDVVAEVRVSRSRRLDIAAVIDGCLRFRTGKVEVTSLQPSRFLRFGQTRKRIRVESKVVVKAEVIKEVKVDEGRFVCVG
jgi:hypothetical protein